MTDLLITADKYCDRDIPRLAFLGWNTQTRAAGDIDFYRVVYRCRIQTYYFDISNVLEPSGVYVASSDSLIVYPNTSAYSILIPPMTATDELGVDIPGSNKWWVDIKEVTPMMDQGSLMMLEVSDWSSYGAWHQLEVDQVPGKSGMDILSTDENSYSWNYFGFQTEQKQSGDGESSEDLTEGYYEEYQRRMLWKIERGITYSNISFIEPPTDILLELNEVVIGASMNGTTDDVLLGGLGDTNRLYLMSEQLTPSDKFGGGFMDFKSNYQDVGGWQDEDL